jgi:hypothetical protein
MLADLLSECYNADLEDTWERERTATVRRAKLFCSHQSPEGSEDAAGRSPSAFTCEKAVSLVVGQSLGTTPSF